MATDFAFQTLLASVRRPLGVIFAHWLEPHERTRHRDEQILRYLERTHDAIVRTRVLAGLTPEALALLARIARDKCQATVGDSIARTVADGIAASPAALAELHANGLVFIDGIEFWPRATAVWTHEHLHQSVLVPPGMAGESFRIARGSVPVAPHAAPVHETSIREPAPAAVMLAEFVHAAGRGTLRVTQQGTLTSKARDAFSAPTGKAEICAPSLALAFAAAAEIVRLDSTGTVLSTRRLSLFRRKPGAEQLREFIDFGAGHLAERPGLRDKYGYHVRLFALETLRTALAAAAPEQWTAVPALAAAVAKQAMHIVGVGNMSGSWRWTRTTCTMPPTRVWNEVAADLVDHWLVPAGVVQTGSDAARTTCVRATSFGQFWLTGNTAPLHAGRQSRLVVQTDFTAVLTHSGPWDHVAQTLSLFAARTGDDNARIYTFNRDHVRAGLRHGHRIEELIELLDAHSAYPVPDNVRTTLRGWATSSSHAVLFRDVNLLSFDSESERNQFMDQLQDRRALAIGTMHVLSLLPETRVLDAMQSLRAAPIDYTQPPVAGIDITPDGVVSSMACEDLRVRALVEAIAEPVRDATGLRFVLSAARAQRLKNPKDIFDQIFRLPGKPLPVTMRLWLLVALGIVDLPPDRRIAVVDGLGDHERRAMGKAINWRAAVTAHAGKATFVLAAAQVQAVQAALVAAKSSAAVSIIELPSVPVIVAPRNTPHRSPASYVPSRTIGKTTRNKVKQSDTI